MFFPLGSFAKWAVVEKVRVASRASDSQATRPEGLVDPGASTTYYSQNYVPERKKTNKEAPHTSIRLLRYIDRRLHAALRVVA